MQQNEVACHVTVDTPVDTREDAWLDVYVPPRGTGKLHYTVNGKHWDNFTTREVWEPGRHIIPLAPYTSWTNQVKPRGFNWVSYHRPYPNISKVTTPRMPQTDSMLEVHYLGDVKGDTPWFSRTPFNLQWYTAGWILLQFDRAVVGPGFGMMNLWHSHNCEGWALHEAGGFTDDFVISQDDIRPGCTRFAQINWAGLGQFIHIEYNPQFILGTGWDARVYACLKPRRQGQWQSANPAQQSLDQPSSRSRRLVWNA